MKILALDTSTNACSVSLTNGIEVFSWFEVVGSQHAKMLLAQIDRLLTAAQLTLKDLDLLAFGMGPGSFTGLRIGASVIQGLSVAHNLKVAGVSSLQALAFQASKKYPNKNILSLLDARMNEVYAGLYSNDNKLINQEVVIKPSMLELASQAVIIGTGALAFEESLKAQFPQNTFDLSILYPRATEICQIVQINPNLYTEELPLPQYIRNNVADRSQ